LSKRKLTNHMSELLERKQFHWDKGTKPFRHSNHNNAKLGSSSRDHQRILCSVAVLD